MRIIRVIFHIFSFLILSLLNFEESYAQSNISIGFPCMPYGDKISPLSGSDIMGTIEMRLTVKFRTNVDGCFTPRRINCLYTMTGGFANKTYENTTGIFDTLAMETGIYNARAECAYYEASTASKTATYKVIRDTTPPQVSIDNLYDGQEVYGVVVINASASDSNTGNSAVSSVKFSAATSDLGTDGTSPYQGVFDTTRVGNGLITLSASATDGNGNIGHATLNVNVNNAGGGTIDRSPTIAFLGVSGGDILSGTKQLEVVAYDDRGIRDVKLYLGTNNIASFSSPPFNTTLNTGSFTDGTYTLKGTVTDSSGQVVSTEMNIVINNTNPPTPTPTPPSPPPPAVTPTPLPPNFTPIATPLTPNSNQSVFRVTLVDRKSKARIKNGVIAFVSTKIYKKVKVDSNGTARMIFDKGEKVAVNVKAKGYIETSTKVYRLNKDKNMTMKLAARAR